MDTPLTADDVPNSELRKGLLSDGGNLFIDTINHINFYIKQWFYSEGRFYPIAMIYSSVVHLLFQGHGLYKVFLVALGLANSFLIFKIIAKTLGNAPAVLSSLFFVSAYSIRYRYFHDGVSSFAGLIPFALILFLASIYITTLNELSTRTKYILSITFYILSILTYEHTTLFVVGAILFILILNPNKFGKILSATLLSITTTQILAALYVRRNLNANVAYTIDLHSDKFVPTFLRQLVSAFPNSQRFFSSPGFLGDTIITKLNSLNLFIGIVAILFVFFIYISSKSSSGENSLGGFKSRAALFVCGANMMITPSLITGATIRWQNEIPQGQGYLCVTLQSAGLAMIWGSLVPNGFSRFSTTVRIFMIFATALLLSMNVFWNWNFA